MKYFASVFFLLVSTAAFAQSGGGHGDHSRHGGMMHHGTAMHGNAAPLPTQPGQAAFGAIQEIVALLEADPDTDWSRVDIEELRRHLADMDNVTLGADVVSEPVDGGMRFAVSGDGRIRDSIRRMVLAHASAVDGVGGWRFAAEQTEDGAALTVLVPAADLTRLKGLGFIGVMTRGMHHQEHHMMIARGEHPH